VASLADDTVIEPTGPDSFRAKLREEWSVWGANGGYLATMALRAAGAVAPDGSRPASVSCQFAGVPAFDEVDISVERVRATRRASALRVRMTQYGKPVLDAHVWAVSSALPGPDRAWMAPAELAPPEELTELNELVVRDGIPVLPIWVHCYEVRLTEWQQGEWTPQQGVPTVLGWMRMREPLPSGADAWLAAGRVAFAADIAQFPAVVQAFDTEELTFIAPSMDLYVSFHGESDAEWLLLEAEGTGAGGGLLGARARIWSPDGRLLGTGAQQMLFRDVGRGWR
jgi:acyl-CoA thioesterase II